MAPKQTVANIDHERRVREIQYALLRLHELCQIGQREGWPDLVEHALKEIEALEAERAEWS